MNDTRLPYSNPHPAPLNSLGEALIAVEWGSLRGKDVMQKKNNSFARLAGDPKEIPNALVHFFYPTKQTLDLCTSSAC